MIIVDTNVWSETTKPAPEPQVVTWLREHHQQAAMTSITIGELLTGLAMMPEGRRRDELAIAVENLISRSRNRVLSYDERAARVLAVIRSGLRRAGREAAKPEDVMIAAIARAGGHAIATRNVADFEHTGVHVIDPWSR